VKICVLSGFKGTRDEGMINVAVHLCEELSRDNQVIHINIRSKSSLIRCRQTLKNFSPDIFHVMLRPSLITLAAAQFLTLYSPRPKVVFSLFQPPLQPWLTTKLMHLAKPDLLLTLSRKSETMYTRQGFKAARIGGGVDSRKFFPVARETRAQLRRKYALDTDKYIILHVGHIVKGRNLQILSKLQGRDNNQVVIVNSKSINVDKELYALLKNQGCRLFSDYLPNLEEIYQLADCYIFPTLNPSNCIETPLSILEAMSCNLPVISTKFGSMTESFLPGEGLLFVDSPDFIENKLIELKAAQTAVETRARVTSHSWSAAGDQIQNIYRNLLNN
jgi:glycosyltransferase involved in cell wall biosynthesis